MSNDFKKKSELGDHQLKQNRIVFNVAVVANASPASKLLASDIAGVAVLRCEGQTAQADAIENLTSQVAAPVDATGIFAMLFDEQVSKIYKVTATPSTGTITAAASISTGGRLIVQFDSSVSLATTDLTVLLEVEAMLKD